MMKLVLIIAFCFFTFSLLHAGWPTTPDSAIFVDGGFFPYLAVDPYDESITVVYLQGNATKAKKYDRYGNPLWGGNSVTLSDTAWGFLRIEYHVFDGQWGAVVSDDSGGAIVAWEDYRNADFEIINGEPVPQGSEIYVQRVDVNGQIRYGVNGKRISGPPTVGFYRLGDIKKDYHGGFVVAYNNDTTSTTSVVKRFTRTGNLLWERYFNGAYIDVNATDPQGNIFVSTISALPGKRHKLDLNGDFLWPDTLVGIIPDDRAYRHGGAFSDGLGGVIGARWGYQNKIRVNRADSTGNFLFGNDIVIPNSAGAYFGYASDNDGGIYVNWSRQGILLQRITKYGQLKFPFPGLIIDLTSTGTSYIGLVSDDEHGVITVWRDNRNNPNTSFYAQRIDSSGNFLWDSTGVELHTTSETLILAKPIALYPDMQGGGIFVWDEFGIFMKQICRHGNLGEVDPPLGIRDHHSRPHQYFLYQNYPNTFNPTTTIQYQLPSDSKVRIEIYNILGQRVRTLINRKQKAGVYKTTWDGRNAYGSRVASGLYIYRIKAEAGSKTFLQAKKMLLVK